MLNVLRRLHQTAPPLFTEYRLILKEKKGLKSTSCLDGLGISLLMEMRSFSWHVPMEKSDGID